MASYDGMRGSAARRRISPGALLFIVFVSGAVPAMVEGSDHHFCQNYVPWTEGACTVDGDGNRRGGCQPCLVGEEWDALRAEIGTADVVGHRRRHPRLAIRNWASQTIATSMFRILAEELLGYDQTEVFNSRNRSNYDVASRDCKAINLEVWKSIGDAMDNVDAQAMGIVGLETLYIPHYASFVSAHYEALQQNTPQLLGNGEVVYTTDQFPPDGSITPANLSKWYPDSTEYGCTKEGREDSGWTTSKCVEGRWYPPQCGDTYPSGNCKEIYMPNMEWGGGIPESMARNTGLNFSFVYAGTEGIVDIVKEKFAKKETFMYYWWEPEPMHLRFPSRVVKLPEGCGTPTSSDPMESDNKCGFNYVPLEKRMHKDVALGEPDLQYLFDKWRITKPQMYKILENHKSGGGSMTMEAAACRALKDELVDWKQWLRVHDRCLGQPGKSWSEEDNQCIEESSSQTLTRVVVGTMCALGLFLLAGLALLASRQRSLRLYVRELEKEAVHASATPVTFESPIMMAVDALQEVSSVRFVSKKLQESAKKAWHLLLNSDNLNAPAIEEGAFYGDTSERRIEMRDAARLVVNMFSENQNVSFTGAADPWSSNFSLSSTDLLPDCTRPKNKTPSPSAMDLNDRAGCSLAMLEKLETADDNTEFLKTVSANVLLNTFHLKEITGDRPLFTAAMMALKHHNLIAELGIDRDAVARFLVKVEDGYQDVPYHNRTHAADVVSRLSSMLLVDDCIGSDESMISKCTVYAAILAAVIHDYDHPGTDNNFQVASNTEMARRWNQQTVLENHSLFECLQMIRSTPGMDVLKGTRENKNNIIAMIIKMVMGTDMSNHFSIMGDFHAKVVNPVKISKMAEEAQMTPRRSESMRRSQSLGQSYELEEIIERSREWYQSLDDSTKVLVLTVAIKVADVGHTFTTWETHVNWSQRLEEEFFMQGRQELKLGREPGYLKHPEKPGVMNPANQLGFSDIIATPLVKAWAEVFPTSGGILLKQAQDNRARWFGLT